MIEKEMDRLLKIKTVGIREWSAQSSHYNRYEATPYVALQRLLSVYPLSSTDELVDFGCGKGRVSIYLHHISGCSVTGVEMSGQLYQEALANRQSYSQINRKAIQSLQFEHELAEKYRIPITANCFYFFNPFSLSIFSQVLRNIQQSVEEAPRTISLIMFYPTIEYLQFIEKQYEFQQLIDIQTDEKDEDERFVIFTNEKA